MKVLVGAFNQEKALLGAFSVIVKTGCGTDGALHSTIQHSSYFHGLITAAAAHWQVKLEKTNRNLQFDETILFVKTILN